MQQAFNFEKAPLGEQKPQIDTYLNEVKHQLSQKKELRESPSMTLVLEFQVQIIHVNLSFN